MSGKEKPWPDCPRDVLVSAPLADGSCGMFTGRMIRRTRDWITLTDAAWVKDTGRHSKFFAGQFDNDVEIEAYPDSMTVEIDAHGAFIYSWPHGLPRTTR